ncbi:MAG TPA: hemerythrin domain-containing protein [Micromonosporaceae bacterium]
MSSWSERDEAAMAAVVNHHAELAAGLEQRAAALISTAESAPDSVDLARRELLDYLHREVVPHAQAEERVLYAAATRLAAGRLLIDGMLDEHRAIVSCIEELAEAPTPVRAAAAARALTALFATHLTKENELVVPLIVGDPETSLADLLAGMHELLGEAAAENSCGCGGCGCGQQGAEPVDIGRA